MTYYLYLIFIPIFIIILYVCIKLVYLKFFPRKINVSEHGVEDVEEDIKEVKDFVNTNFHKIEDSAKNGFTEVREMFWKYFDIVFDFIKKV